VTQWKIRQWKRKAQHLLSWVPVYLGGVIMMICFVPLRLMGLIVIKHWERFPVGQAGFIIAPNHPSLFDPFRVGSYIISEILRACTFETIIMTMKGVRR
jgi:hypothetical protein